ncbi:glycosyltransferase [Paracoccus chinensis]|uniref:Putative rhamnosyl transferase n=1 Tax=Paracoccus chinensis TaxID=525640 RepID=A0A1G9DLT7_9RHOB|nr:glycosyltransferase [Paracoccus chinensis]SDK64858.1 Putative rhamnosyl transferase [Paracoccus chinensis]
MKIVGICRFSLVGRGDWRETRKRSLAEVRAMASDRASMLFAPERMEARLATFEHLTLASLQAQTDPDFTFLVLASDLMPQDYKDRLQALCAQLPQVVLRYFPVTPVPAAQKSAFNELGIVFADTLQFRLDDDDCICADYIEVMRRHTRGLMNAPDPFVASLTGVMLSSLTGPLAGVYDWPVPYYSAGAAMRHPTDGIYQRGHFGMSRWFLSLTIPRGMALVTHNSTNDTTLPAPGQIERGEMSRMTPEQVEKAQERYFPFLTETGKRIAGLTEAAAPVA